MPRAPLALLLLTALPILAADWPMWQGDAGRTAWSRESLPGDLHPQWVRRLPPLLPCWEDPVNRDRMPFGTVYEPVAAAGLLVFASSLDDSVTALDVRTGVVRWRMVADGPFWLPPVIHAGRVFAASDDGQLYALDLQTGAEAWRFRGGLDGRRVLGNGRLASAWCARGGPVIVDGTVCFGAGIWPFMGTFIHRLDAATGRPVWTQDTLGDIYSDQPHGGASAFGGVAPQGALAAAGDSLVVPNGRSVPAVLDLADGSLRVFKLAGSSYHEIGGSVDRKLEGGAGIITDGRFLLNVRGLSTALYDLASGDAFLQWRGTFNPVLADGMLYLGGSSIQAFRLADLRQETYEVQQQDRATGEVRTVQRKRWALPVAWELPVDATGALILAGNRLYAGRRDAVAVIGLDGDSPTLAGELPVAGTVGRLLASEGRLFAVTIEGGLTCFGADGSAPPTALENPLPVPPPPAGDHPWLADAAVDATPAAAWMLAYDPPDPSGLEAVLARSEWRVVAVAADPAAAARLRSHFLERGIYGTRVTVHVGDPRGFGAPPYLAVLTQVDAVPGDADPAWLAALLRSVRPYGGVLRLRGDPERLSGLAAGIDRDGVEVERLPDGLRLRRPGALPGAGLWSHHYADAANSAKSSESRVRPPLGLLWFGGNSHHDVLPRHGHGPIPLVLGGRLFVQGTDRLTARDVYTGATLWQRVFSDLGTFGVFYDATYKDDPLDTTYNQVHIPGANARGTNMLAAPDAVYLVEQSSCLALAPASGATLRTFALPAPPPGEAPSEWSFLGLDGDVLLGGTGFAVFSDPASTEKVGIWENYDTTSSRGLVAFDRHTGAVLWQRPARLAFRHNAIAMAEGLLFCIDAVPEPVVERLRRRGALPEAAPSILALDLRTGDVRWERREAVFGTWLSVSLKHRLLLQAGRASRDMIRGEPNQRLMALRTADGSVVWDREVQHGGPLMLHGDRIILPAITTTGAGISILDGTPLQRQHPLTRRSVPWTYHRRYGCNSVIATEHMLTFRSGAAGFYDLAGDSGTGNFGGFKSGCTPSLVAADGVLNAPDYTRTCTCSYQNQTSLALVHDPGLDFWTANEIGRGDDRILDLAVNLGAPGDRRGDDGLLWFEFPMVGGPSPELPIAIDAPAGRWYQHRSAVFQGDQTWIAASGIEGDLTLAVALVTDAMRYTVIRQRVTVATDDAEESSAGRMAHGSSDLELTLDSSEQTVGIRFPDLQLDAGRTLVSAHLQFTSKEAGNAPTELVIRAQAADTAPAILAGNHDLSSRALTTAAVRWTVPPWTKADDAGAAQRTPDLSPLLREVLSRPGWQPGNAICFIITGTGKRVAWSADGKAAAAPLLQIAMEKTAAEIAAEPPPPLYTLRLVFAEPDPVPRRRVFDALVDGQVVLPGVVLDGPARQAVVHTVRGLALRDAFTLALRARADSPAPPALAGFALTAEP